MIDDPDVSVVIPAFNSAWSIADTLTSVLGQSLAAIEVIVVDDGSSDDLGAVLAPFLADRRLRIVRQDNRGLAAARNRGIREARAPLVACIDADDMWHCRFLEILRDVLLAEPEAPFGYALLIRVDMENRIVPTPLWRHEPRHDLAGLLEVNSVGCGSASLFRRDKVLAAGGFDESLNRRHAQGAEDWKLALLLASEHPPAFVCRQLVAYRLAARSMSRSRPDLQLHGINTVMGDIRAAFPDLPARHFCNARTVMNGWLLPAFYASGRSAAMPGLLAQSYLCNPLWFLSRDVRAVHWHKLRSALIDFGPRKPLQSWVEGGERPFAFLDGVQPQRRAA